MPLAHTRIQWRVHVDMYRAVQLSNQAADYKVYGPMEMGTHMISCCFPLSI